jgi:hypothetical protein
LSPDLSVAAVLFSGTGDSEGKVPVTVTFFNLDYRLKKLLSSK